MISRKAAKSLIAKTRNIPLVFVESKEISSGKSFSRKEILRRAEKVAAKRDWRVSFAEKVVRREIARLKVNLFKIPTGAFVGMAYSVKGYRIRYDLIEVPFPVGGRVLWKYRAKDCSCPAGSRGRRCWHQDYTDYMLDGLTTIPQKYGPFNKRMLKYIVKQKREWKAER
jgi:hypothetical protein